jgi:uncharacterized protein (TIGR02757 family)
MNREETRRILEAIYEKYHRPEYLHMDPLCCVRKMVSPSNIEIGGFIASALSCGRVQQIISSIDRVLYLTGDDLCAFLMDTSFEEKKALFVSFRHRFNDGEDMAITLESTKLAVEEHGSLHNLFARGYDHNDSDIRHALEQFVDAFRKYSSFLPGSGRRKKSFEWLIPSPRFGGACKRLNMYLRWMVRENDGIDFGLWADIEPSKLIMPVDTHIAKVASRLKLTKRKAPDWRMAEEITRRLRQIDPVDPLRYDFSLCRAGMLDSIRKG